ncbi:hypothetical protein J7L00_02350 [Candidatus Bathyarchaeota archaeon]|nr:hypothetical protein [Candidatus Bathyarchaeota archaeon]
MRLDQYLLVKVSDEEAMLRPALRLREEKNRENLKDIENEGIHEKQ